ncbi:tRNA (adenosine(37)-N6)-dimethylallyltransferase MiaA [Jiulongibacter sediminis]|uniref:tRNA dimethylallyltransferase n=1 Tax=Jiulongibacter sediminis TaxID=1605367 RepID=A0A0P7BT46_9BACT|nr:tRNA (adenosine(37)-N6)-dimethylallyltransferase MiaA [Jiulongibacter sediminis]KPM48051.1 tRNA delta(2)-isopentenylpyrophosphate transferase [Jiulongibacter sediminis]TBX24233.1 tRNA delta(2)-isopentenylpyrophosphate transferase [Jiulongibacter sediminis]
MSKNKLVLIVGPTAVGKTDLCIRLAQKLSCDIFSCDSRQFYQEMSIGTAKPRPEELAAVKHHFINNKSIEENYTVSDFEQEMINELDTYFSQNNTAILTGGSGLFAKAVTHGFDPIPDIPKELRDELVSRRQTEGIDSLIEELKQLDPEYCKTADLSNSQRVLRALEVSKFTKRPFSSWHQNTAKERDFDILKIALERPRKELYERINLRVDLMLNAGLIEEVRSLEKYRHKNALQTVGYREIYGYLDGDLNFEEAAELVKRNSRRYAKRQLTWFKNQDLFEWFHPDDFEGILKKIKIFLKK